MISLFWIFVHNYYVDYVRMLGYYIGQNRMNRSVIEKTYWTNSLSMVHRQMWPNECEGKALVPSTSLHL